MLSLIINASVIAEQRGYSVSKEEALADLLLRSEQSFKENMNNPHIGVKNSADYFQEQLRRMGMDQTLAVKIWREVLLFRRLFNDLGNSVFVDTLGYQQFNQYALQMVGGNLYELPKDLRFARFADLQKLETYLNAVTKRESEWSPSLDLPTNYLSADEVAKKHPELVQQVYKLEVAQVDRKALEARVGLKETWDWETNDSNWKTLKEKYPELGMKKGDNQEERLAALDSLDAVSRSKADQYARSQIVEDHPDWIKEALVTAPPTISTMGLRSKGGAFPFLGIEDREALIKALNQAPLNEQDPKLAVWKAGNKGYYQIRVLDRSPSKKVLTFAEAKQDGTLDELIKDVTEDQFKGILEAIKKDYVSVNKEENKDKLTNDKLASLRFYKYMRENLAKLQKDPSQEKDIVLQNRDEDEPRTDLKDQWKLEKKETELTRGEDNGAFDVSALLKLKPENWSNVHTPLNGDLNFFYVLKEGVKKAPEALTEQVERARWIISNDAKQRLMLQLLQEIQAKKAISFDYLTPSQPTIESEG